MNREMKRRGVLRRAGSLLKTAIVGCAIGLAGQAQAAEFNPTRPVRLVYPFPAGQTGDFYWRGLGAELTKLWKQPVIIDNRPGAGGVIATDFVMRSPQDGYILLATGTTTLGLGLFNKIAFDPTKDLRLVSIVYDADVVLTTNAAVPVKNFAEFVAYAKANPGRLNYASLGKNSTMMYLEWFKRVTGTNIREIPYRGTPDQIEAMLRNDVQLMYIQARPIKSQFDSGKFRPLFIVSPQRLPDMPDIPTNVEVGLPDYRPPQWSAVMAAKQMPDDLIQKIRADVLRAAAAPELEPVLFNQGNRAFKGTAKQGDEQWDYTVKVLTDLAKELNIKPE